jgi:hypothetical protein
MIDIKKALRIEKYYPPNGNGGPKKQYIFKCLNCNNEIKIKTGKRFKTATGLYVKCNNAKMHPEALKKKTIKTV